eukprot:TRINITY_DN3061_c0_g1_i3.p1 TRINITY_DN3061_c0_g1~~TRINITY_DN3061_c0_g1_i3.p1  ORF type:complete len:212 (+),score=74.65 TRINITY_DN3061_c0_g1_i3:123-758(+)
MCIRDSLSDVRCVLLDDAPGGFRLEFEFLPNPFFSNSTLTKTYFFCETGCMLDADDIDGDLTEGCSIDWKPGKNLTMKIKKKKRTGKGKMAPITKTEPCETFFNFFSPPTLDDEMEDFDDDEIEGLEEKMEDDMTLGESFRYTIVPHAVKYFMGENSSDDSDMESDEGEDDSDSDGDDHPPAAAAANVTAAETGFDAPSSQKEQQPECKQQ